MPLQIRRGTPAERTGLTTPLAIGELLYTTDGKLYIGDGTSIGPGVPDIAGNVGQGGKGLIVTGFTSEEAQDATAALFNNGTHANITFSYNDSADSLSAVVNLSSYIGNIDVEGTIDADFKGSLFADDSGLLIDAVDRKFFGNLEGNVVGSVIGDIKGSVFGDDSTLLVDAVNSVIPAAVVSGTFTGNVVGNFSGNIITNSINSSDSSNIIIETPTVFENPVTFNSDLNAREITSLRGHVVSINDSADVEDFNFSATRVADDYGTIFNFRRSKGTIGSPTAIAAGDKIATLNFIGHDGNGFSDAGFIEASAGPPVTPGNVPGVLRFVLKASDGLFNEIVRIESFSFQTFGRKSTDFPMRMFNNHDDNPTFSGQSAMYRSRGTFDSPTAVQSGDRIASILFAGHDGSSTTPGLGYGASVQIRAIVDGAVGTNQVPGRLEIATADSSGTMTVRMRLDSDGQTRLDNVRGLTNNYVTFNQMPVLPTYADETAADTAIGGSGNRVNGMMYYNTALGAIRAVVGGSWTSL
jgi:hypothetical protein